MSRNHNDGRPLNDGNRRSDPPLCAVRQIFGTTRWASHSTYLREEGEQGDPLMPMLFSLVQHRALVASQERFRGEERLRAFLDDVHVVCAPDTCGARVADPRSHPSAPWQDTGLEPRRSASDEFTWVGQPGCICVERRSRVAMPVRDFGRGVLGVPIGQQAHVQQFLAKKGREQETLFHMIPWVNDPQAALLILLMCGSTRANFWSRAVGPTHTKRPLGANSCWAGSPPREPDEHDKGPSVQVANMRQRLGLITSSAAACCSRRGPFLQGPSSGLKLDQLVGWHCPQLRRVCRHASSLIFPALFSCGVFVNGFFFCAQLPVWPSP